MKIFPLSTTEPTHEKLQENSLSCKHKRNTIYDLTGLRYQVEAKFVMKPYANGYHVWALILAAMYWTLQDVVWPANLPYGIGVLLISVVFCGIANIFTVTALAELVVLFPQAGGVVGFGRVALGHMFGFVCGVLECIDLATNTALGSLFFSGYIQDTFNTDPGILIVWSFLIYVVSFAIIYRGGRTPWDFMLISCLAVTVIVFLVLLAAMLHGNFFANAYQYSLGTDDPVNGHTPPPPVSSRVVFFDGIESWLIVLPATFWT